MEAHGYHLSAFYYNSRISDFIIEKLSHITINQFVCVYLYVYVCVCDKIAKAHAKNFHSQMNLKLERKIKFVCI